MVFFMTVTIREIASYCNVSEGTVDRALNNRTGISSKTKERILAAAKKLDYKPNILAQCLATGSTKTIGVVCGGLSNRFFASLIEAIETNARNNGYFISLVLSHNSPVKELEGIHYLARRQADGIIIFPVGYGKAYEEELKQLNIPIVTLYNRISENFTHVDTDCRKIMREAVKHILLKGYKNIVYMDIKNYSGCTNEDINFFSLNERCQGYKEGMEQAGLNCRIVNNYDENLLISLASAPVRTTILCPYDVLAIKIVNFYRKIGIQIPSQIGIMGFDNIDMLENITPLISSVDCNTKKLGEIAFSILLEKITGTYTGGDVTVGYSFTEGESL